MFILNLQNVVCQLYLGKAGEKWKNLNFGYGIQDPLILFPTYTKACAMYLNATLFC